MKLVKKTMIAIAISSAMVATAQAGNISYNYVDINYASFHQSGFSESGFDVGLSAGFGNNAYFLAEHYNVNNGGDRTKVGVGYHMPLSDQSDFVAAISYRGVTNAFSQTASGYEAEVGARMASGSKFSFDAKVGIANVSGSSGIQLGLLAGYRVTNNVDITASYLNDDWWSTGLSIYKLGARINF